MGNFSSYIQKDDYALNFLGDFQEADFAKGNDQFIEEEVVIPKHLDVHITYQKSFFPYDHKIDKQCQQFPGHLIDPNIYHVFSIYEISVFEQEDNNVVKVVYLTHKQFDQQFHEDIRSIVCEESDLTYSSCGSKLQLGFEKQPFLSAWIRHNSRKLVYDCYNEELERGINFFYQEHI
jgi:hypothetical protein